MTPSPAPPPARPPADNPAGEGEEVLDERLETERDPQLGAALRALLDPAGDVRSRAAADVDRTLQGRSVISTLTDLGGIGWVTVAHLLTSPTDDADRNERSEDRDD